MKVKFKVQHQILSGMKYLQVVKRMGISSKTQEMIGSYGPNTTERPFYEKTCKTCTGCLIPHEVLIIKPIVEPEEAPTGMMARAHYNAVSKFIDDDNHTHLKFEWSFNIKKDW